MRKLLRQTWMQVIFVYMALFLLIWIGLRHTSSSDLATNILCLGAILSSVAYAVYTLFRKGKLSTRPQWWLDFATDKNTSRKPTPKGSAIRFRKPKETSVRRWKPIDPVRSSTV